MFYIIQKLKIPQVIGRSIREPDPCLRLKYPCLRFKYPVSISRYDLSCLFWKGREGTMVVTNSSPLLKLSNYSEFKSNFIKQGA